MTRREPKQSQLDYLWVNYGDDPKFNRVELKNGKLIGYNNKGLNLFEVEYSGSSSSYGVTDFGVDGNNYYIELSDGKRLTAPIKSSDLSKLEKIVDTHTLALLILNGEGEGSLLYILELSKLYTDSKLINLDVSKLLIQVDKNSADLLILKGSAEQEGSVLNIVNSVINSALNWENLIN